MEQALYKTDSIKISRWLSVMFVGAIALSLGSCTNPTATNSTKKLQIVTTFIPLTEFTTAIAGDRAIVTQLLPSNVGREHPSLD